MDAAEGVPRGPSAGASAASLLMAAKGSQEGPGAGAGGQISAFNRTACSLVITPDCLHVIVLGATVAWPRLLLRVNAKERSASGATAELTRTPAAGAGEAALDALYTASAACHARKAATVMDDRRLACVRSLSS